VALLTALTACATATTGTPKAVLTSTHSTTKPEPTYSLARLCELLSPEEAEQLGGSPEGEKTHSVSDGHAVCQWSAAMDLVVGFQEGPTTADADTGPGITNTSIKVDGLTAVQSLQTGTFVVCEILVDLPSGRLFTSSAAILTAGEGKYDPCEVANRLANLVVPRVRDQ
jgi:hypothetical protein